VIRITPVYCAAFLLSFVLSLSGQDDINITYPNVGTLYSSDGNGLQVHWNYQSQSNDMQSLSWAYKLDEDFYGTSTSATQVDGNDSVDGSSWLSGLIADGGSHTLYVALLDQGSNVVATDNHDFTYQSGSSGTQSGDGGTQSPDGGYQSDDGGYQSGDGISIHYPDVSILYSSDYNGMQVQWNYQSQSNDMQSLSWAYKLDEDFYSTGTSATQVDGNDSVDGSSWLSGLTADGGSHTLYVALLDGTGNPLAGDQHSFTYNAGSDPYSSGGDGYQSDDGGTQSGDGGYQSSGDGYQSDTSGYNTINITYPTIYNVSDWNSLEIEWTYASGVANQSSPRFGYTIDENITSQDVYISEFNTYNVYGSEWLAGLSDGEHTVYVALLDPTNGSILATDSHVFSLTSSTEPEDPGTSNDVITILNPGSGSVIERNATLSVDLSYASEVSSSETPRWAYKINEDFYSTQTSAIEVNSTSVSGWLDDLEDGEYTVYVALLMTYGGDYILAQDNVTFELSSTQESTPSIISNFAVSGFIGNNENSLFVNFVVNDSSSEFGFKINSSNGHEHPLVASSLTLFKQEVNGGSSSIVASNENWQNSSSAVDMITYGFEPANSSDAGFIVSLEPGLYTIMASGVNGDEGFSELIVQNLSSNLTAGIQNIGVRTTVGNGNWINSDLKFSFEIAGESPMNLMATAIGQTLENYGVFGVIPNPSINLQRESTDLASPVQLLYNDDWEQSLENEFENISEDHPSFVKPVKPEESGILVSLKPDLYSLTVAPSLNNSDGGITFLSILDLGIGGENYNFAPLQVEFTSSRFVENDPVGTQVGEISATDPDEDYPLSFTLLDESGIFHLSTDGKLKISTVLDYEIQPEFNFGIRVSDIKGASFTEYFSLKLENVVEDLDNDGIEDYFDSDQDGDGVSDSDEIILGTDPRNPFSVPNRPPLFEQVIEFSISEITEIGSLVGKIQVSDPDGNNYDLNLPSGVQSLNLADFNGDNVLDLIFEEPEGVFNLVLNINGSFTSVEEIFPTSSYPGQFTDNHLFSIDADGSIRTKEEFDYETDGSELIIGVQAIDSEGASSFQKFKVLIADVFEDLDGDEIEDHYDEDDDGDGFSDEEEIDSGTDPRDPNSVPNRAPHSLILSNAEVFENEIVGTLVGEFSATDPDGDVLTYRIVLNDYSSGYNDPQYDSELDPYYEESSYDPSNYGYTDYSQLESYGYDELGPDGIVGTGDEYMFLDPSTGEIIFSEPFGDFDLGPDGLPDTGDEYILGDSTLYDPYYGSTDPLADTYYDGSEIDELYYLTGNEPIGDNQDYDNMALDLPFDLDENGKLTTTRVLDYETNPTSYTIVVEVMDPYGFEYVEEFTINLLNVVEDLDGDGDEDHYDEDDDGDGFSDEEEMDSGTDPRDANSMPNRAPVFSENIVLEINENASVGSLIDQITASDPDGNDYTFSLPTGVKNLELIDMNQDGFPDLLIEEPEGVFQIVFNEYGTFKSIEELFPTTSYPAQFTDNALFSIDSDGQLYSLKSFDFESDLNEYIIGVQVTDTFGASSFTKLNISVVDVFEDLDGDGIEDHLDSDTDGDGFSDEEEIELGFDPRDTYSRPELALVQTLTPNRSSDGKYILRGKLLADGGVQLSDLGFEVTGDGFGYKQSLNVDTSVSVGREFTLSLEALTPGETYSYRAFASNVAGYNSGALRKFTVDKSQDWWFGAEELDAGWKSNWIGVFLPQPNGWAYHADLGWAYISPDSDGGIWFWVEDNGWHWTREGIWPFMWSNNTSDWMYLMKSGSRTFIYDYSTESFITDF
jgi:hypothetical protein